MARNLKAPVVVSPVFVNGTAFLSAFGARGEHCVAVASSPDVAGFRSRFAREKVILKHRGAGGEFVEWLLSRRDLDGALVIPTGDEALGELDARRDEVEARFRVSIPPRRACEVALDKSKLAQVCTENNIPIPRTAVAEVGGGRDAAALAGEVGSFPIVVKPSMGEDFHRLHRAKLLKAETLEQLSGMLADCGSHGFSVILQELLPGEGTGAYSAYITRGGEIAGEYSSRRIGLFPPRAGVGYFEVAEHIPEILTYGRRLIRAVGYRGALVNIDFKFDARAGGWRLLDLNARSWRQITLATLAGVPVFDMLLADYAGKPVPKGGRIRYGCYWLHLKDALTIMRGFRKDAPPLRQYARMLASPFVLALWHPADPMPFLSDVAPMVLRRFRKSAPIPHLPEI